MKKIVRDVDEKRGIVQITVADERWYMKAGLDPLTEIPAYASVPSVTWIYGYWPKGVGFYKWLADKGSRVHLAIERILKGEGFRIDTKVADKSRSTEQNSVETELTYEELLCVKSFIDWMADTGQDYLVETIANEIVVFSDIHGYAGTVDWVVRLTPKPEGKNPLKLGGPTPYVVDFKTSKQVWKEYELQVSAYRMALENGENPIREQNANGTEGPIIDLSGLRTAILQVGYDRNKAGYKFTEVEDAFPLFKVAQQIWKAEVGDNTPGFTKREFPVVLAPARETEVTVEEATAEPANDDAALSAGRESTRV